MFKATLGLCVFLQLGAAQVAMAIEDPTRPPVVHKSKQVAPQLHVPQLQSILVGRHRRLAMIDHKVLSVGQRAGIVQLLRINNDSVVVRVGTGKQLTLSLANNKIHKEAK